jgi:hypothetical protein
VRDHWIQIALNFFRKLAERLIQKIAPSGLQSALDTVDYIHGRIFLARLNFLQKSATDFSQFGKLLLSQLRTCPQTTDILAKFLMRLFRQVIRLTRKASFVSAL